MDGKTGRPSEFTQEVAKAICDRIAGGESLRSICSDDAMPGQTTVFRWLDADEAFREQYTRARDVQADTLFDEMLDIADDGRNDWMERHGDEGETTGWRENGEAIRRSQLRIEARKWMAGKLKPKKYGDKIDVNHSGSIQRISDEELDARLAQFIGKAGGAPASGGEGSPGSDEQA
jgi:hypothetical protein